MSPAPSSPGGFDQQRQVPKTVHANDWTKNFQDCYDFIHGGRFENSVFEFAGVQSKFFISMSQVKLCPICNQQNSPQNITCNCGFALDSIDPVWISEESSSAELKSDQPQAGVEHLYCSYPDCGAPNPIGSINCLYCGRLLTKNYSLEWPWQEKMKVQSTLIIGREPPAPPDLIVRLEREYPNVSRRHAEFKIEHQGLSVCDLGSSNGTFVNDQRLTSGQACALKVGDRVRFAAQLICTVRENTP